MTKQEFMNRLEDIYNGDSYEFVEQAEALWTELQRAKKSQQRQYQRRIKALTEQD